MVFNSLSLHDACLSSAHISWEAARCSLRVYPVGLDAHWLDFEGFTLLELPRQEPWGPSVSINTVREPKPGCFEIELQSGDVLRIAAVSWSYRAETVA